MKKRALDFIPYGSILCLWLLFYLPVLFQGQTFVLGDSSRFFFPLWKWGASVWQQGVIPLWNPAAGFGTPYLADPQMAAWYPPLGVAYLFLDPITAFNSLIAGHHLWALVGFLVFARSRGFSSWVSLCGALVFGFSFNAVSLRVAPIMFFAYSWIPWIFWAADRLWVSTENSIFLLSFFLAMQMASGYPVFSYLTLLLLGWDWLSRRMGKRGLANAGWGKKGAWSMAALFLAVLYNAAWLLPFREFVPLSNLADRVGFTSFLRWDDLLTWFNPFLKGHPLHSHPESPYSVTVYFASLPLLVALLWGSWIGKLKRSSLVLLVLTLVLSLGETAWLGGWLKGVLPLYAMVVRSGYWIPFVVWVASLLFMETIEVLASPRDFSDGAGKAWLGCGVVIYGAALGLGVPWDLATFWISFLCFVLAGLGPWSGKSRLIYLSLALVFSLGPVVKSVNFFMSRDYYGTKPEVAGRLTRPGRLHYPLGVVDGLKVVSGNSVADTYKKIKESMFPNGPLGEGFEETSYLNSLFLKSFLWWYNLASPRSPQEIGRVLDYLNVRYVFGWNPGENFKKIDAPGSSVGLWENPGAFPKWFSVSRASGEFPVNFHKECFVLDPSIMGNYEFRMVRELDRTAGMVSLEAKGSGKALLVSSETDYPGWVAWVNGKRRPVLEVNHGFRGVILEKGEEKATLSYSPSSFRLGCFLSLLVCGFWAGIILKNGLRPRYA